MKRNKRSLGFGTALVIALAVLMGSVGRAYTPDFQIFEDADGQRWLVGCVSEEVAERIVSENGFQPGLGPAFILCIEGTVPVYKQLGR